MPEKCDCEPCGIRITGLLGGMAPANEPTGENALSRATLANEDRRLAATLAAYMLPPYMLVLRLE